VASEGTLTVDRLIKGHVFQTQDTPDRGGPNGICRLVGQYLLVPFAGVTLNRDFAPDA